MAYSVASASAISQHGRSPKSARSASATTGRGQTWTKALRYHILPINPLAGGLLTDKYQRDAEQWPTGSRFDAVNGSANYRARYWNDAYFDALDIIRPVATKLGISTAEAALRRARYYSKLRGGVGDAVIVAATSAAQLDDNLRALNAGPLPDEMVKAFDDGWAVARGTAVKLYFRPVPELFDY